MNFVTPIFAKKIVEDLQNLGYTPEIQSAPCETGGHKIVFEYEAVCEKYFGQKFLIGISVHEGAPYPEHPPHWIHIHPPYRDPFGGVIHEYTEDGANRKWIAMSRPPGKHWDEFRTPKIGEYIKHHVRRIFHNLQ